MYDDDQTFIPPSFVALHSSPAGRLKVDKAFLKERHEVCEDLAQHLTTHCRNIHVEIGVDEQDVLSRCHQGLATPESGLSESEAHWVIVRLAELLGWPHPDLPGGSAENR